MSADRNGRRDYLNELMPPRLAPGSDRSALVILLLVSLAVKLWLMGRATAIATDGYGFIRTAQRMEAGQFWQVVQKTQQHPLYPVWIWVASKPVRWLGWWSWPRAWELSAQLACAFWALVLLWPMYALGRRVLGRPIAFWGTLLFCLIPVPARLSADGLSDFPFLTMVLLALWLTLVAVERRAVWLILLAYGCIGLAYLTRPEGLIIGLLVTLFLVGVQARPSLRWPWGKLLAAAVAGVVVLTLYVIPYASFVGGLTQKSSFNRVLNWYQPAARGLPAALCDVCDEFARCNSYTFMVLALAGCIRILPAVWRRPGHWLCLMLFGATLAGTVQLSWRVGYVSQRHVLPAVAVGSFWAAAGVALLGRCLWLGWRWCRGLALRRPDGVLLNSPAVVLSSLALAVVSCLPGLAQPLHYQRGGHLQAAQWLRQHSRPRDLVVDLHKIASFHAGRPQCTLVTCRRLARKRRVLRFLVAETNDSRPCQFRNGALLRALLKGATAVAQFPAQPDQGINQVVVYELAPRATLVARRWGRRQRRVGATAARTAPVRR